MALYDQDSTNESKASIFLDQWEWRRLVVRELYIFVSHSMLCYGLYFINMKMVFPVVQLCLTPPLLYSEYSDRSDYWMISTYCLTTKFLVTLGQSQGWGRNCLWLLPSYRLGERWEGRGRVVRVWECKQKLNLKLWSLLRRIMMRRKYQHELQPANHPNNITILLTNIIFLQAAININTIV